MSAQAFLRGLALAGYRSFGRDLQRMGPFGPLNIFVGANNSGKSNILRFIYRHLHQFYKNRDSKVGKIEWDSSDKHIGYLTSLVGLAGATEDEYLVRLLKDEKLMLPQLKQYLSLKMFNAESGLYWCDYKSTNVNEDLRFDGDLDAEARTSNQNLGGIRHLWGTLTRQSGGDVKGWISDLIGHVSPKSMRLPSIYNVPDFRSITSGEGDMDSLQFNGKGLIESLSQLQDYAPGRTDDGKKFEKIQNFVRAVIGEGSARIRIPYDKKTIAVSIAEKDLHLHDLGTGIHQTILLAAMGTMVESSIVCLEEPETHLHPIFQRKLLRYLAEQTNNQYFIATHSAHLLDCGLTDLQATVFRVRMEEGQTIVNRVAGTGHRIEICRDLGYHASDLVQANCIIWVEGPSDRIYLKHWIGSVAPELVEGIDFSIMFYGGALLCYLTGDEDSFNEVWKDFVALRPLNRNAAILMDSDKKSADEDDGPHKLRIVDEFKKDGFAWITAGRTIENYLPVELQKKAFLSAHPRSKERIGKGGKFGPMTKDGKAFDKVAVAQAVAQSPADLTVMDLAHKVSELVDFIRKHNPQHRDFRTVH